MKIGRPNLLLIITAIFLMVLVSIFLVRQKNGNVISLSEIENPASMHTALEDGKININTADASQLQQLPKIGEVLSQRIIKYRKENGDFKSIEDIKNVSGIGDALFASIADYITIGE